MKIEKYSNLRNFSRPPLERLLPLKFPMCIYIETTNCCNYRCRYCPLSLPDYSKMSGGFRTMNMAEFKNICQEIQGGGKLKVLRMGFMGEPLLNPLFPEMLTVACQMKLAERTELTSNAVFLNKEKSEAIINSGLNYLRISISSVYQDRQEYVTQSKAKVDEICQNLKQFRQIRDRLGNQEPFLYIKMLDSLDDVENTKFLEMYMGMADEAVIEKPMNWDSYNNYNFLLDIYKGKKTPDSRELYLYPKLVCPFPFYNLVVNVNGDVTVCCVDWNKATKVGNVFKDSLKSIWDGDKMREFRCMHILKKRNLNSSCRNCQYICTSPDNLDNMSKSKIKAIIGVNEIKSCKYLDPARSRGLID